MTEIATPKPEEKEVSEMSIEDVLRVLYQKIHFREMDDDEMSIVLQSLTQDPVETIMGMLQSPELISRLLNLNPSPEVASNALAYVFRARKIDSPEQKFFMHLPKTAGTSINSHIQKFSNYAWLSHGGGNYLHLWPLVSGHFHWSDFPSTSRGLTVLRDPLERLVSAWQYMTSRRQVMHNNFLNEGLLNENFSNFLKRQTTTPSLATMSVGASWFFTDTPTDILSYHESANNNLESLFYQAFNSFEHIACIEDPASVSTALKFATGSDEPFTAQANKTNRVGSEPQSLSQAEYERLFELTAFEYRFLNYLFEKGIITFDYNQGFEARLNKYLAKQQLTVE
jgi:hypothetical protein